MKKKKEPVRSNREESRVAGKAVLFLAHQAAVPRLVQLNKPICERMLRRGRPTAHANNVRREDL